VRAAGRERDLFEHGLVAVVRGRSGRGLARRPVTAVEGRWSALLAYAVAHRQAGTVEAVAASAKDGSLVCLAQSRVTLPASGGSSS
jgi:Immunoglobulin-like domain of bacterial spore germination